MSKKRAEDFAKSFKNSRKLLKAGDIIELYNNKYRVIASKENGKTLLKDMKEMPVAYDTDKLRSMLQKSMMKAIPKSSMPSDVTTDQGHSVNDPGKVSPRMQQQAGVRQKRQIGEIQNGKMYVQRGSKRYWVSLKHGTTHDEHNSKDSHASASHPEDIKMISKVKGQIKAKAHPSDHKALEGKFNKYVKETAEFNHLRHAINSGSSANQTAPPKSMIDHVQAKGDKARDSANDFKESFKQSIRKNKKLGE